jgi:putative protease
MELLVNAASLDEVAVFYEEGADALIVGHERYALRVPGSFEIEDIERAKQIATRLNRKLYVAMNALFHQDMLDEIDVYIKKLREIGVDAIQFGDPAVLMSLGQLNDDAGSLRMHWNTETTLTNYHTVNFWARKGVHRAVLARELSLDDVLDIKRQTNIETQVLVHGMTCIVHSKRELVSNFARYQGKDVTEASFGLGRRLFVKEDKRHEQKYPIYEDVNGTHIMSYDDICMIEHLSPLINAGVDSVQIDTILKSEDYSCAVIRIYREAIDLLHESPNAPIPAEWMEVLQTLQPQDRPLCTGFYFKEQIY